MFPKKQRKRIHHLGLILFICFLLISQSIGAVDFDDDFVISRSASMTALNQSVELRPGDFHTVRFSSDTNRLEPYEPNVFTNGLSPLICSAIAKSPTWLQPMLTQQFHSISNPDRYAQLIINATRQISDEIAFVIAASSIGNVPEPMVILKNAEALYRNDKFVEYADIIDVDNGDNDYYSTIIYRTLEDDSEKEVVLPKDIYYWYVVHPEISSENADEVYGEIWRDYLLNHNDIRYPLLKEKISGIKYLWDGKAYSSPGGRLWNVSITAHPTAIEAIGYWIGKTVPYGAMGSRPGQPQKIAHEHNGWCGELQRLAVAAQRTLLVPSVAACNVAEDHVWREFYERGWHQNDNWWYDGGGTVDIPDVYSYGWGKNMSSVYGWRGDDAIYEQTARYIHSDDRVTISFNVRDLFLQPIDGARVTALVTGIKDITWYKSQIWDIIQQIWDRIPQLLKGNILQQLFDRIQNRFEEIPDIIDGVTISVWNYTDTTGTCTLTLGKNLEYVFLIQSGNLRRAWQFARHNTLRILKEPENKTYNIIFSDLSNRPRHHIIKNIPDSGNEFTLSFQSTGAQYQSHLQFEDIGRYPKKGVVEIFIVDKTNLELFKQGKIFRCFSYNLGSEGEHSFNLDLEEWYLLFYNPSRETTISLTYDVHGIVADTGTYVDIVTPSTSIFSKPTYAIGDKITIAGVASHNVTLTIENTTYHPHQTENTWDFLWNTTYHLPGNYSINAQCQEQTDSISIQLYDIDPPSVEITIPYEGQIIQNNSLVVEGTCYDSYLMDKVQLSLNNNTPIDIAYVNGKWDYILDIGSLPLGDHILTAHAFDLLGNYANRSISFVKNETGHSWGPIINEIYYLPQANITNTSNIVVYANITQGSPFRISHCILTLKDSKKYELYRYGDYPQQDRHWEDPLINVSNKPLYGVEFAQLPSNTYHFNITCYDTANNKIISDDIHFIVN